MATYLQGVTDYIPQFQPFQPDLNFYASLMQTKQSQYDSNWKALNKVYGQYFYADLTRDPNIKKKDELLKQIEFNLKRVSGLDLSLEQNVNQATQVFKPFYEDKNLMKDMAWTKTYNRETGRANSLKGSSKEEDRKQYWDTGLKELNYRKDEFKEASDEEAMGMSGVSYTPYVNTMEKALKLAKDAGLSVESVKFTDDQRWIITQKNGQQLIEPLEKLFESTMGSDPGIQSVYKTQAYVNRKDYAFSNAGEFNGDKNAAEMKYLENSFTILKKQRELQYRNIQKNSDVYDKRINDLQKLIDNKKAPVGSEEKLQDLKDNKQISDDVLARVQKESDMFSNSNSTSTTSSGFSNPYSDVATLRYKVDAGMASTLMEKDFGEAAQIYAYRDAKTSIKENPYKVLEIKQANEMQQIHTSGAYKIQAQQMANQSREKVAAAKIQSDAIKAEKERKTAYDKMRIETGAGVLEEYELRDENGDIIKDPNTGEALKDFRVVTNPNQKVVGKTLPGDNLVLFPGKNSATVLDAEKANLENAAKQANTEGTLNAIFNTVNKLQNKIGPGDLAKLINPDYALAKERDPLNRGVSGYLDAKDGIFAGAGQYFKDLMLVSKGTKDLMTVEDIQKGFQEKGVEYLTGLSKKYGDSYVKGLVERVDGYLAQNAPYSPEFEMERKTLQPYVKPIKEYGQYEKVYNDWLVKAEKAVGDNLKNIKITKTLSTSNPQNPYGYLFSSDEEVNLRLTDSYGDPFQNKEQFISANKKWSDWAKGYYTGQKIGAGYGAPGAGGLGQSFSMGNYTEASDALWNEYLGKKNQAAQKGGIPAGPAAASVNGLVNNVFQNQANAVFANQKAGDGRVHYNDMMRSILNSGISFDGTDGVLTYGGFKKSAITDAKGIETQQKLFTVLNDFNNKFNDFTKPTPGVEIGGVLFAAGEKDKVGNYIRLPKEFLDTYYNQSDPDKGFLSKEEYDGLLENGLSAIASSDKMMNSLIEGTYTEPLEAVLKYNKKLEFVDPIGGHSLKFSVPPVLTPGSNQFQYESTINVYDPQTGKTQEFSGWEPTFTDGRSVTEIYEDWEDFSQQLNEQNTNIKYGLE